MKIQSVEIKNFKAIGHEKINMNGNNVYVVGQNGVGKTSFLDAIFKIIHGKEMPSKVVKEGQEKGFINISLDNGLILNAKFNSKHEKVELSIESADGASYKSPRTMLDSLAGVVDFDIDNFFNLTPQKKIDFIKNIAGIDFSDLDDEKKKTFEQRTVINAKVKELESKQSFYKEPIPEEIKIDEIQKQISEANEFNKKRSEAQARFNSRREEIFELKQKLSELEELQTKASIWLEDESNKEIDTKELQESITEAIEFNKQVALDQSYKKLADELKQAVIDQSDLNKKLEEIEETKRRVISESQMPVEGLEFSDNEILYNGLPFEKTQINTAQQIIIGLQINLALLKDIKIARFDGSLLDDSNIEIVEKWAKENDLQLFVEFVERNSEGLKIEVKETI